MIDVFKGRGIEPPIVYLHNHDFNGMGGHIGAGVLRKAQSEGYNYLVVDAAYRKNGTHNDNTIVADALHLSKEQSEALIEYGHIQQQIEQVITRFDSRTSQMTPWDSDWAGGTEGSDIRIAKEFALDVRKWVKDGGKLKVGGDVLVGLKRWETLVPKTPEVDKLLANMADELEAALSSNTKLIGPEDLPDDFTPAQIHTALGYQAKGLEFTKLQAKGRDITSLLAAPHVLHRKPRTLPANTRFELLHDTSNVSQREIVDFGGFGTAPNGDILMAFHYKGKQVSVQIPDPDASMKTVTAGPRKATPGDPNQLACIVPGEILSYVVKPGDILEAGGPLCVLESMKMELKISVPDEFDGKKVKALPCKGRTKELQGDILKPGDLLLEVEDA